MFSLAEFGEDGCCVDLGSFLLPIQEALSLLIKWYLFFDVGFQQQLSMSVPVNTWLSPKTFVKILVLLTRKRKEKIQHLTCIILRTNRRQEIQQKLPRRGTGSSLLYHGRANAVRFHCSAPHPCLIAQHKIRLLKRNCLSLAGPKGRSSLTTLSILLSGVCWILKQGRRLLVALHLQTNSHFKYKAHGIQVLQKCYHWHLRTQPSISPTMETPQSLPSQSFPCAKRSPTPSPWAGWLLSTAKGDTFPVPLNSGFSQLMVHFPWLPPPGLLQGAEHPFLPLCTELRNMNIWHKLEGGWQYGERLQHHRGSLRP